MKKLLLILITLSGCAVQNRYAQKPFIIMEKHYIYSDNKNAEYRFEDANGKSFMFYDDARYFNIGDTIR